jgi:GNAT superfamily N-acetyltransferase
MGGMEIREAAPAEYGVVGELTASVYVDDGHVRPGSPYVAKLRDAERRGREATLLVAVDEDGTVIGSVAFALGGTAYANIAKAGEAEFRTLVVAGKARRRGVGEALVQACAALARKAGAAVLRLSTGPTMTDAQRLYERLGFARTPDLDWSPDPAQGDPLRTYELDLRYCDHCGRPLPEGDHTACRAARELDPPRWCAHCRRRMVVQVTPTGWTARCVQHGQLAG